MERRQQSTSPEVIEKLSTNDLIAWLKRMPEAYYPVFSLSVIDGFSHPEIAEMLNIDAALSRKRLSRANSSALPQVLPYTPSPETFRRAGGAKLEFSASAGSSLMLRNYLAPSEGNAADGLNAAVGNTFGQSISFELSYGLSSKLRLNTGLEYWRTHNTFRYTIERDSSTVHPSFPNRTTAAKYIRRVTHNNYQQFLSLPVLLEYRQAFGLFEAGMGAGIALNYQLQASGRTLASVDEVVSYDSSSGDTPDFFLSYRLRPSLMFSPKPNSRTKLLLQTNVQYYRFGESAVTGLSQRAILLGGSVGVTYRL